MPLSADRGPLAVFGGTFDPIHRGHLRSALELKQRFGFAEVRLMPAARPPHRQPPRCAAAQRAEMVELALAGCPGLSCDWRELRRPGPSYTYDSVAAIRAEEGPARSICLALGADAVAGLNRWHRWRELLRLVHIVVLARPGYRLPTAGEVAAWLRRHSVAPADATMAANTAGATMAALLGTPSGAVEVLALTPMDVSSTRIRAALAAGRAVTALVPDAVSRHIERKGLYRPPAELAAPRGGGGSERGWGAHHAGC